MNKRVSDNRRFITKIAFAFAMAVLLFFSIPFTSSAATKNEIHSSIYLTVLNAPDDYYIVPLEYDFDHSGPDIELFCDVEEYRTIEQYMMCFRYRDWVAFDVPSETENCIRKSNPDNYYEYTYVAPNPLRILIVDMDGNVYLSDNLYRQQVKSRIIYDVETGKLTEDLTPRRNKSIAYVIVCLLLTLVLELGFLKAFDLPYTKINLLSVVLVNIVTSLSENLYLYRINSGDQAIKPIIIFGILITVLETLLYLFVLRSEGGTWHKLINMLYGIVANILSAILLTILIFIFKFTVY